MTARGAAAACAGLLVVGLAALAVYRSTDPTVAAIESVLAPRPEGWPGSPAPRQADAVKAGITGEQNILYWRAMRTTARNLVLVSVSRRGAAPEPVVMESDSLINALEYELGPDWARAYAVALAQKDRTFLFTNSEALELVRRRYTDADLERARRQLAECSDSKILHGGCLEHTDGDAALAHALIERGLLPGRTYVTGRLYVTR